MNTGYIVQATAAALLCGLAAPPASAAEPLPDSVLACRNETDDAKRLECFDREVARHATTAEERFGLRRGQSPPAADAAAEGKKKRAEQPEQLKNISANVTALSRRALGEYVITLDNAQVWAQTQPSSLRIEVGDSVTIRAAALGSFLLSTSRGGTTRVARVR